MRPRQLLTLAIAASVLVVALVSSSSAAGDAKDVVVVGNDATQPVPVTGTMNVANTPTVHVGNTPSVSIDGTPTVNIGNSPTVKVAQTPFQQLVGESHNSEFSESCDQITVEDGQSVMLENVSVEAGRTDGERPDVYLRVVQNGNLVRFNDVLTEGDPSLHRWGGFWDVDVLVQPGLSSASICATGPGTQVRAIVTGYHLS